MKQTEVVAAMVLADPEAFGFDVMRPNLGFATTGELLSELTARFIHSTRPEEHAAVGVLDGVYAHLDPASLGYRP